MRARAPLDVDLEDKLLYGLTPMRLAYLVVGLLGGFALWSSPWAPSAVRAGACFVVVGGGAVAAWGRWRGRTVDAWVVDVALFVINTRRLEWNEIPIKTPNLRPTRPPPARSRARSLEVIVAARAPMAGATTVVAELTACFATRGSADTTWSVRQAQPSDDGKSGEAGLLVSVAAVDAGRVCYVDRGDGPFVAALIPEDESVRHAAALGRATVLAFPDAPASAAFHELADVIASAV
jgi:hypothetical protein